MAEQQLGYSSLLIELDCLVDTRMATLVQMGDTAMKAALDHDYHERPIDIFPGVDEQEFKRRYENRTKQVLQSAVVTPMAGLIKDFTEKTLSNVHNSPFHYKPKVILNIHPYKLSEKEIEVLIASIKSINLGLSDIEVVDLSYEQITPMFVKANLSVMVLYEYDKWLEAHSVNKAFEKTTCPEVTLLGPRIYFKKPDKPPKADEDPFEAMQTLAGPFIGLVLLPIEQFSLVLRPQKKQTA